MAATDFLERYGPVALVTGASSGIGLAFAEELAERGFDLVVAARRTDRLDALAARLHSSRGTITRVVATDLSDPAAPAALLAALDGIDIGLVVSNAGFNLKGAFERAEASDIARMLMVNCHAPMQLAHGFIARLKARGKGGLILTGSVEGLIGCPYSAAYAASKALVISLGEGLWGELQGDGIDVLTLCPGATESEATARYSEQHGMLDRLQPAAQVARLALDHIAEGPTFIPHPHYREVFGRLLEMPRRDALIGMAASLKATA